MAVTVVHATQSAKPDSGDGRISSNAWNEGHSVEGLGTAAEADASDFAAATHTHAIADVTGLQTALDGKLASAANLSDLASAATARTNLGLGTSATMAAEWTPNFTAAGDAYIPVVVAMTIAQGNAKIGTGTLAYAKSTAAAPSTFTATTLPVTLEAGAWLKVTASAVTGFVATHLKRTA
jgi:hypothetical protein